MSSNISKCVPFVALYEKHLQELAVRDCKDPQVQDLIHGVFEREIRLLLRLRRESQTRFDIEQASSKQHEAP
jgi:hypothetical protein